MRDEELLAPASEAAANAADPIGVCAERAALARSVAEGTSLGDVEAVAITASPCGGRRWPLEFGAGRVVFDHDGRIVAVLPADLQPESFTR